MIDYGPLVDRAHPGRRTVPLALAPEERTRVEAALRPATAEQRIVKRAQALLMAADGVPGADIARALGVNERTVRRWRERFSCPQPSDKLADAPRSGRPPSLSRTSPLRRSSPKRAGRPGT